MKFKKELWDDALVVAGSEDDIKLLIDLEYKKYLRTDYWKSVRSIMRKHIGKKCEICGFENHIHVHHFNYDNLGKETFNDLACLCEYCHSVVHNFDDGIIDNLTNRIDFNEKIEWVNEIKSRFTNKRLLTLLPFVMRSCWRTEELAIFLECEVEELSTMFRQELLDGLIVEMSIIGDGNAFKMYLLDNIALYIIRLDFPKLTK